MLVPCYDDATKLPTHDTLLRLMVLLRLRCLLGNESANILTPTKDEGWKQFCILNFSLSFFVFLHFWLCFSINRAWDCLILSERFIHEECTGQRVYGWVAALFLLLKYY